MQENDKSIRSKLIKLILVISSLSLVVAFSALFAYEIISYRQSIAKQLRIIGTMFAQNSTAALAFDDEEEARDILSSLRAEENIIGAALYRPDGSLFVKTDIRPLDGPATLEDGLFTTNDYFDLLLPVIQGDKRLGTLYIRRGTEDIDRRLLLYSLLMLGVLLLGFSLTYFLSRRFERSISDPIIALADTAKVISGSHDYSQRASVAGEGEIRTLTTAFNDMVARIETQNAMIQQHAQDLEIKVAERTLEIRRQKDFAETVINSSLVLIAVFDTETRFISFNKRCEVEFGLRREDVLGKRFSEAMPAVVGSPAYKAVIRALNGEIVHNERYRSTVSGEYYEGYGIPLRNEKNEVYAALLTAHNITEIVNASDSLVRTNEELKKKNAELEQFAYVASHDLQEPLRKIQVFADVATRSANGDTEAGKYLRKIEVSAERMSRLIKAVLEYSKLSKVEESFIDTDLNLVLDYVKSDFELLISEKQVVIESSQLPVVKGNQLQLHQLFANLINNAIKFSEATPRISIRTLPATDEEIGRLPSLRKDRKYTKLIFADNGIGFDARFSDQVFTIFQRLNSRDKYEGTGIGLALCKKIVENHNGHISVDSTPGKGTTFSVILPER